VGNSSFWKKEISLRRAAKEERLEDEPETTGDAAVEDAPALPAGDYGWLTAGFDPNDIPEDMPAVSAPPVSEPAEVAAPEAPSAPELPFVAVADIPDVEEAAPAEAAVPFWKRDLKVSKPKRERAPKAAKKQKQPKAAKEPKAPKEAKAASTPFWKRDLKVSKPKLEKAPKGPKAPKAAKQKAPKSAKGAVVGLKIGASQVAAARVANGPQPQLLQVAREALPDGVVVGGELRDVEALSEALKALFGKNKLPKKNVRLGIANNRIGVRTFEIAGIDDPRQLANAIRFRAQETLPIPLEEAVLDWQVLAEWVDEESGQMTRRVLLVVAYRELVDRYVAACKKAGLKLSGIDLEAFAMLRALSAPSEPGAEAPAAGAQVVVNVGHDRSTFAVSDGRLCEFTRVLGWGGQSLSVAIARALDVTPSEAAPVKHALSLVATAAAPEGVSEATLGLARDAVIRELQAFARELVSSLRFYQNQPGSLGIAEVVLTGGTAHLPGFAEELNRLIGVPVRVGDPLNRVVVPKKFSPPDDVSVGSLTVAIGLGIED
jgi:type IV pilus assembly protein PilM